MKRRSFLCLYSLFMLCIIELGRLFSVLMNYGFVINSTFSLLMWCLFKREKFCANWFSNTWIFISKIFKSAVWRNVLGESNNLSVNQFSVFKNIVHARVVLDLFSLILIIENQIILLCISKCSTHLSMGLLKQYLLALYSNIYIKISFV